MTQISAYDRDVVSCAEAPIEGCSPSRVELHCDDPGSGPYERGSQRPDTRAEIDDEIGLADASPRYDVASGPVIEGVKPPPRWRLGGPPPSPGHDAP